MCRMQTRDPLIPDADIETFKGQLPSKARRIPRYGLRFYARRRKHSRPIAPKGERALYTGEIFTSSSPRGLSNLARSTVRLTRDGNTADRTPVFLNHMSARLKSIGRINRFDVQRMKTRLKRGEISEGLSGFRFE